MNQEWGEDDLTPTAADLDAAYGSRFTSALDIGNKRIRDDVTKVWMEELPQLDGKPLRKKCVIGYRTLPKPIALNATNRRVGPRHRERSGGLDRLLDRYLYGADQEPAGADGARLAVKSAVRTRDISTEGGTFTGTSTCCGNRTAAG